MPGTSVGRRPVTLRLELACDLSAVRSVTRTVMDFLREQGWEKGTLMSLELALVEACNNAVKYAEPGNRGKDIVVETCSDSRQVEFRVRDHTPGFDWPQQLELPSPESESGRGLFLIRSLSDYAGYFRGNGENFLVMCKRRPEGEVHKEDPEPGSIKDYARKLAEDDRIITQLVEELSSCYESLSAIFRYSSEQAKAGSLKQFAHRLLEDLLQIVSAEWFVLRIVPKGESRLVVYSASEPALEFAPLDLEDSKSTSGTIELKAARERKLVWFDCRDPEVPEGPVKRVKPGAAGLVQPILLGDQLLGTLTLGKQAPASTSAEPRELTFTAAQTSVVSTFSDFLAIQIGNTRFQEEQFRRRLVTHELEIANNIQRSLLLTKLPNLPGIEVAAFCRSAHEVGGDFYDALKVNDHSLLLVIADVMGKGIPAAMFAAILRTLLRAAPELTHKPAALLERVNHLLFPELSGVDMFITAQLAFVDSTARKILVASAGHCPLAIADGSGVRTFAPEGMPLGILEDTTFQEEAVDLPKDCRVLLFTDGLTEALNADGQYFGQQRLMDWLKRKSATKQSAEELKQELAQELASHQANTALNDDQTFLIMKG